LALLLAEPAEAPALADPDLLHGAAGLHLAHARQGFEDGERLHLPDELVAVGLLEQLRQGDRPHLELLLQLGAHPARLGGLLQRGGALLGGERRRKRHAAHPSALPAGRFAPPGGAPTPPSSRAWGPCPTPGRGCLLVAS